MSAIKTVTKSWVIGSIYNDNFPENPRKSDYTLSKLIIVGVNHEIDFTATPVFSTNIKALQSLVDMEMVRPIYRNGTGVLGMCATDENHICGYACLYRNDVLNWYHRSRLSTQLMERASIRMAKEVYEYGCFLSNDVYRIELTDLNNNVLDICNSIYGMSNAERELDDLMRYYLKEYSRNKKAAQAKGKKEW